MLKLKPCKLVNLSVRERGGVTYKREDLGSRREGSKEESAWRTNREIFDIEEHAKAVEVRGKARALCMGACVATPFTTICLNESFPLLLERKAEAEALVSAFNAEAKHGQLHFHLTWGEVAENSREAVESLRSDISYLLAELKEAAGTQDVKRMKDLASRCNSVGKMLEDSPQSASLAKAVKAARSLAKAAAKAIADGADRLEDDLAEMNLAPIHDAWFEFIGGAAGSAAELSDDEELGGLAESLERLADQQDVLVADPYSEGYGAAAAGKSETENPHEDNTNRAFAWASGWADRTISDDANLAKFMKGSAE